MQIQSENDTQQLATRSATNPFKIIPENLETQLQVGHRGLRKTYTGRWFQFAEEKFPEQSEESLRAVNEKGIKAAEIDIKFGKDMSDFIYHDKYGLSLKRMSNWDLSQYKLCKMTHSEINEEQTMNIQLIWQVLRKNFSNLFG